MSWKYYFKQGDEFTPIELSDSGELKNVVIGMCLITSLEAMKEKADKIWEVDDIYAPTKAELIYSRTA